MDLKDQSQPARNVKIGRQRLEITAGKNLRIETSPDGEDILDATIPEGKNWNVYVYLEITETNA